MKFVASDPDIGSTHSVAQRNVTNAAPEAVEVVEQLQGLDHHSSTAAEFGSTKTASLFPRDGERLSGDFSSSSPSRIGASGSQRVPRERSSLRGSRRRGKRRVGGGRERQRRIRAGRSGRRFINRRLMMRVRMRVRLWMGVRVGLRVVLIFVWGYWRRLVSR